MGSPEAPPLVAAPNASPFPCVLPLLPGPTCLPFAQWLEA